MYSHYVPAGWLMETHCLRIKSWPFNNRVAFCCLCINGRGHPQLLFILIRCIESQSHKSDAERTELLFSWIYITEPPPKPRGNGKMEFPACFNGQPWASWVEGTTELWHTRAHSVHMIQDAVGLTGPGQACMFHSHCNARHSFSLPATTAVSPVAKLAEKILWTRSLMKLFFTAGGITVIFCLFVCFYNFRPVHILNTKRVQLTVKKNKKKTKSLVSFSYTQTQQRK